MSSAHLTIGSKQPPKVEGLLRLYSMEYCPFAQRARLVLNAKEIPHDIVNINLIKKPEWYFNIHPEGMVPALDTGSQIVIESLDICDFLDEKYPSIPLYPAEPETRQKDKDLIKQFSSVIAVFARCYYTKEEKTNEEWLKEFLIPLNLLENELANRGTTFFGGEKPGMPDYMLWPWGERVGCIGLRLGKSLPLEEHQLPLLRKWRKAMRAHPVVDKIYNSPEKYWKVAQFKLKGVKPDYDNL